MTEQSIYRPDYIELVFNGGAETIYFSNWEILGEVSYVPRSAPVIRTTSGGFSHSQDTPQAEYFSFVLKYQSGETRIKWEKIRKYVADGYTLVAKLRNIIYPHAAFPPVAGVYNTDGSFQAVLATFSPAVIELPPDFAFDQIARGQGARIVEDVPIRILQSVSLPVPASACSALGMADFTLSPFSFTGAGNLDYIIVERNISGLIASITSYPAGEIRRTGDNALLDTASYNAGSGFYGPDTDPNISDGQNLYITIPNIPVTLTTGDTCTVTFTQYYVTADNALPVASGVVLSGVMEQGQTIVLNYTYSDADGDAEAASTIEIISYNNATDANNNVSGTVVSTSNTYVLGVGDLNRYFRGRVVPVAASGLSPGVAALGAVAGPVTVPNLAPTASAVTITGSMQAGMNIVGSFTYFDAEGDLPGSHVYSFYSYTDAGGTLGETLLVNAINYNLTASEVGKYIRLKVTPVAQTGTSPGAQQQSTVYGPVGSANTAPVASSLAISGYQGVGNTLTASYAYSDADGDAENLTETDVNWYSYTSADLITGKTLIQSGNGSTGLTYLQAGADAGKWINFEVTPAASIGASPGVTVASTGIGPIYTKIATLRTDKDTSVNIQVAYLSGQNYQIRRWENYTSTTETPDSVVSSTGVNNLDSNIFSFSTTGQVHRVEIWGASIANFFCVAAPSMEITYVDLSACTSMGGTSSTLIINLSGNSGLNTLLLPATIAGRLGLNINSSAVTAVNISGWRGLSGTLGLISCTSLGTLALPTVTSISGAALTACEVRSCTPLSGALDFTGCAFGTNYVIEVGNMASVTSLVLPDLTAITPSQVYIWSMGNAGFTSAKLDKVLWAGTIRITGCANVTDLGSTGAATFTPTFGAGNLNYTQITSLIALTQNIDFSASSNARTIFQITDCANLGTVTLASANDKTFTFFYVNTCNQSSVSISGYTQMMDVNNSRVEVRSMSLSAAVVNALLVHLDSITDNAFTGRVIDLSGNSAPDTTSGGVNGVAAKSSLITKGISVTTA
jgi:hypothetical protein